MTTAAHEDTEHAVGRQIHLHAPFRRVSQGPRPQACNPRWPFKGPQCQRPQNSHEARELCLLGKIQTHYSGINKPFHYSVF